MSFLSPSHLAPYFVSPLLQSLDVIDLVHLDLKGFSRRSRTPEVWGSWGPQWAIYPACTWAGGGGGRRRNGLFGGAMRRWGGGGRVQGQRWDQTTTLEAWKNNKWWLNTVWCVLAITIHQGVKHDHAVTMKASFCVQSRAFICFTCVSIQRTPLTNSTWVQEAVRPYPWYRSSRGTLPKCPKMLKYTFDLTYLTYDISACIGPSAVLLPLSFTRAFMMRR